MIWSDDLGDLALPVSHPNGHSENRLKHRPTSNNINSRTVSSSNKENNNNDNNNDTFYSISIFSARYYKKVLTQKCAVSSSQITVDKQGVVFGM